MSGNEISRILPAHITPRILDLLKCADGVILAGSYAVSRNISNSDVDIVIFSKKINYIYCDLAMQYSTDLSREYDILQNERKLKDINIDSKPSVSLSIGGGINSQADNYSALMDSKSRRFNVILSLSVPLFNWGTNKINKNIVLQEIHKSDLQYETTKKNDLASYKYDLRNVEILLSETREDKALLELLDKRLELIKMNVRYGKIDMSKIIQAEKQFVQNHMNYINKIKTVFLLIYKYMAIALIDIRNNSSIVKFTS